MVFLGSHLFVGYEFFGSPIKIKVYCKKIKDTPLKTNMAPENRPLEKDILIGNHHFWVPVKSKGASSKGQDGVVSNFYFYVLIFEGPYSLGGDTIQPVCWWGWLLANH